MFCPEEQKENGQIPISLRAISLGQLRNVRELLKRLCKAGLLQVESKCELRGTTLLKGQCLEWPMVNQHHIRYQLIMKVIRKEDSCSWVEMVAGTPQKPKFFVSHNWSQPFRDFMVAIEHQALEFSARPRDSYWICVYAVNQFQVDVGDLLETSPFITALQAADSAVLILDKTASSLTRLWCLLEVNIILSKHEKLLTWKEPSLRILTPMGVLGTASVSSGPVVEALRSVDSVMGVATQSPDRRHILNYIAEEEETRGLKLHKGVLKTPKELDPEMPEEIYEKELLERKRDKFYEFNKQIHDWAHNQQMEIGGWRPQVVENFGADLRMKLDNRLEISDRGLTLAQLRTMWRRIKQECINWRRIGRVVDKADAGRENDSEACSRDHMWSTITLYDFEWELLKKTQDEEAPMSFMEHFTVSRRPQEPEYYICTPYRASLQDVIAAVEWHAEARGLPDSTVYWAWFFSLSLQDIRASFANGTKISSIVLNKVPRLEGTVIIVDEMLSYLTRPNMVYEIYRFLSKEMRGKPCDICCKLGVLSSTKPFGRSGYQFGGFSLDAARAMTNFDVAELAKASGDAELQREFKRLSENGKFNRRVRKLGCGPVLRKAAAEDDVETINKVVECTGVLPTSPEVAGVHGEGPLMVAAAAGSLRAMAALIRLQADPNCRDAEGETPLHYAALAGKVDSARLLMRSGARADLDSIFEERPSTVAAQNPAFFLGVECESVYRFLREEERLAARLANRLGEPWLEDSDGDDWADNDFPASLETTTETEEESALTKLQAYFRDLDPSGSGQIAVGTMTKLLITLGMDEDLVVQCLRYHTDETGKICYARFISGYDLH